jgi:hypothetical protein
MQKLIDNINRPVSEKPMNPNPKSQNRIQNPLKTQQENPISVNFFFEKLYPILKKPVLKSSL